MSTVVQISPKAEPVKVRLSPMISEALPLVISWAEKPENVEFFRRFPPLCMWLNIDVAMKLLKDLWLVYEDSTCVGLTGLYSFEYAGNSAEVCLLIDSETSSQKPLTARLAGQEACEYGFGYLRLNKISSRILEHRSALGKRLEDNGFKLEGILREAVTFNGKYCNELLYGCLATEYKRA
jgi:RimJ/RimL family protein N-acetyltransferase